MNNGVSTSLKGKEFEACLVDAAIRLEKRDLLTMSRYGVEVSHFGDKLIAVPSKPDFEGVVKGGWQFIIEAKVCSQSSFKLTPETIKARQVSHMLRRSSYGVSCWLLIHWNQRVLLNSTQPAFTCAIPIRAGDPRWVSYVNACKLAKRSQEKMSPQGSISRDESLCIGQRVPWRVLKGCRVPTPDLLSFVCPEVSSQLELPTV